jgi:hypothetical protein
VKETKEQRKHLVTAIAIVGGGGVVLFVIASGARGSSSPRAPNRSVPQRGGGSVQVQPHSLNFGPNPAQPQVDEALIAAREAALAIFDQSAATEHGQTTAYQLGVNQDVTARAIAANTNATQLKETGITTTAAQAIAEAQARTQLQEVQAATSAQQSIASGQQSTSLWQTIIGGIFSAFPFLRGASSGGIGLPMAPPVQYGTAALPPTQYAVPDPINPWTG